MHDTSLRSLSIFGAPIPFFLSGRTHYSVQVASSVSRVAVEAVASEMSSVTIAGAASGPEIHHLLKQRGIGHVLASILPPSLVTINPGSNDIRVVVQSLDGVTTTTYHVTVVRGNLLEYSQIPLFMYRHS